MVRTRTAILASLAVLAAAAFLLVLLQEDEASAARPAASTAADDDPRTDRCQLVGHRASFATLPRGVLGTLHDAACPIVSGTLDEPLPAATSSLRSPAAIPGSAPGAPAPGMR